MKKIIVSIAVICIFYMQSGLAETVDINTADAITISKTLKGVGLKKATRIVEFRTLNGPFRSIEDIVKVKGIGPKIFERNKSEIMVSN